MKYLSHIAAALAARIETKARTIKEALSSEEPPLETVTLARPRQLDGLCEGCSDSDVRGVYWPTVINHDDSHPWIERCDFCQRFTSDTGAAEHLLELGLIEELGVATPEGSTIEALYGHPVEEIRARRGRRCP